MLKKYKLHSLKDKANWALIGLGLWGLTILLMRIGKKDPWLGRALKELDGIYRFENADGRFFRYLVFERGKVKAPHNWVGPADFTFTFYEPPAYYLKIKPEHIFKLVFENKIAQAGNTYYLFQFGFIMSLVERYFKTKKLRGIAGAEAN